MNIIESMKENIDLINLISKNCMTWAEGYIRYQKIRRLGLSQYTALYQHCLRTGENFDDAVDKLEIK